MPGFSHRAEMGKHRAKRTRNNASNAPTPSLDEDLENASRNGSRSNFYLQFGGTKPNLLKSKVGNKWQCVAGSGKAIIGNLLDAGWQPTLPHVWHTPGATAMANILRHSEAPQVTADYFADQRAKVMWKKASLRSGGKGLERGAPCFSRAKRANAFLKRRKFFPHTSSLEVAVVGGVWTNYRFAQEVCRTCTRCSLAAVETPTHRYFDCPPNALIEDGEGVHSEKRVVNKIQQERAST